MSRIVRHFMRVTPPVEPGSAEFWTAGDHNILLPMTFNQIRFQLTGPGGGGYLLIFGGNGTGTTGGTSLIPALGLQATGGAGGSSASAGPAGVGSGGDVNNAGTVGTATGPGTPIPGLGDSGIGGRPHTIGRGCYGSGGGYTELTLDIGDPRVLPNTNIAITLGAPGRSSGYNGNTVYVAGPGGCIVEWW